MGSISLFYLDQGRRKLLIDEHLFYVTQARERLLSQFDNIEEDANSFADQWLKGVSHLFNPDVHDVGDFYDQAYDQRYEYGRLLIEMQERTRLSVAAGMFHEWDKNLRGYLLAGIRFWHDGEHVKKKIWESKFDDILDLVDCVIWKVKSEKIYNSLDRCRGVVNVFKHGSGPSCEKLFDAHPEFFKCSWSKSVREGHEYLRITDQHISEFSDAIVSFWESVPLDVRLEDDCLEMPKWFERAYDKDRKLNSS